MGSHRDKSRTIITRTEGFSPDLLLLPKGGGVLSILSDGNVPFFRVSFLPIFSRTGYQKKANFLEQVVKKCKKKEILLQRVIIWSNVLFSFYRFFLEQGII